MATLPKNTTPEAPSATEAPKAPPVVEAVKVDVSTLAKVVQVKSKIEGKVFDVSRSYYERNSHKLELVE